MTNKVAPTDVMLTRKCLISIGMVLSTLSISPENLQLFKCGNQTEKSVYQSKCYKEIMLTYSDGSMSFYVIKFENIIFSHWNSKYILENKAHAVGMIE